MKKLILMLIGVLAFTLITCQNEDMMVINDDIEPEIHEIESTSITDTNDLLDLIITIEGLVSDGIINQGNGNALISKINNAIKSINKGNATAVSGQLIAVINQINDFIGSDKLTEEQGETLIHVVENVINFPGSNTLIDTRDGQEYSIVHIANQIWMAENLAYYDETHSLPYDNDESNIPIYGLMYDWNGAMTACPTGWHLPSNEEWEQLAEFISSDNGGYVKTYFNEYYVDWYYWNNVGGHLKSTTGWDPSWGYGNGTDDYGFTGLAGGFWNGRVFSSMTQEGHWWSSTEHDEDLAWKRNLLCNRDIFTASYRTKHDNISVRCIKD